MLRSIHEIFVKACTLGWNLQAGVAEVATDMKYAPVTGRVQHATAATSPADGNVSSVAFHDLEGAGAVLVAGQSVGLRPRVLEIGVACVETCAGPAATRAYSADRGDHAMMVLGSVAAAGFVSCKGGA